MLDSNLVNVACHSDCRLWLAMRCDKSGRAMTKDELHRCTISVLLVMYPSVSKALSDAK